MLSIHSMDLTFSIEKQIELNISPAVLVNIFILDKSDESAFLKIWQSDAAFMKRQPGFISTQLHRAIGESPIYLNYAVWESTIKFKAAFMHPEFLGKLSTYPSSVTVMPHLFEKIAVPDICVA